MPLPYPDIKNGDTPDVELLMANLEYLLTLIGSGGVAIAEGTLAARPESPAVPQFYYAKDEKQMYYYSVVNGEWTPQ